jgi:hypothetical protein
MSAPDLVKSFESCKLTGTRTASTGPSVGDIPERTYTKAWRGLVDRKDKPPMFNMPVVSGCWRRNRPPEFLAYEGSDLTVAHAELPGRPRQRGS